MNNRSPRKLALLYSWVNETGKQSPMIPFWIYAEITSGVSLEIRKNLLSILWRINRENFWSKSWQILYRNFLMNLLKNPEILSERTSGWITGVIIIYFLTNYFERGNLQANFWKNFLRNLRRNCSRSFCMIFWLNLSCKLILWMLWGESHEEFSLWSLEEF